MRAYRVMGAGRAEVVDLPRPEPGPGEVLLRVLAAGVCRTDLALLHGGGDGLALPVPLGHETRTRDSGIAGRMTPSLTSTLRAI